MPRSATIAVDILEKRRREDGGMDLLVRRRCAFHSAQITGHSRSAILAS